MKHRNLFCINILIILFLGVNNNAHAQTAPPEGTPYITLKVKKDVHILIDMEAPEDNTTVWIESENGVYIEEVIHTYTGMAPFSYMALDTIMRVHGDILFFACGMNGINVTGLDISQNKALKELIMCGDNISGFIDFGENPNLTKIDLDGNSFSSEDLDMIYCSLLPHPVSDSCRLSVLTSIGDTAAPEYKIVMATNGANANAKNWRITSFDEGWFYPIENTTGGYECSNTSITDNIVEDPISIYPNPAKDVLTVSLSENIKTKCINIIDMAGKTVLSQKINHTDKSVNINISSIAKGMYILNIGNSSEKIIIE